MRRPGSKADLYLNDKLVGQVSVRTWDNGWGFGDFTPNEAFGEFAPVFGQWSLLMHVDQETEPLSPAASEELRLVENAMDAIRAKLFFPERSTWLAVAQVNIDGPLVEWKEA